MQYSPGDKIKCKIIKIPCYVHGSINAQRYLTVGTLYTISNIEYERFLTLISLEEIPGVAFISDFFDFSQNSHLISFEKFDELSNELRVLKTEHGYYLQISNKVEGAKYHLSTEETIILRDWLNVKLNE